jgi:Big-like domain-containing protein
MNFFPHATALTRPQIVRSFGHVLLVVGMAAEAGCRADDWSLGLESSGISASVSVAVASVTISPTSFSLSPGATRQLKVVLKNAAGNILTGRLVTWKSSNTAVATVSSTGLVKAVTYGSSSITATAEGKVGISKVTVKDIINWIWSTGFESSTVDMNLTSSTHAAGSVTRVGGFPHKGLYSLKFITPSRAGGRAAAFKVFPFTTAIHIADLWFKIPKGQSSNAVLEVTLEAWSGTQAHLPAVNWIRNDASNALGWRRYINGNWQYVPGGRGKGLSENVWHHLKLEVDYAKKVYRKLTIDNTVFLLTNLPYDVGNRTVSPRGHLTILLWTSASTARTAYVDDVKLGKLR